MQGQEKPEISVIDDGRLPPKGEATSSGEGNNNSGKRKVSSETNKNKKAKLSVANTKFPK